MSTTQTNTAGAQDDNPEVVFGRKLEKGHSPMTQEQQNGWKQMAEEHQGVNAGVKNTIDIEAKRMNMSGLTQDEVNYASAVANADGNFSKEEAANIGLAMASTKPENNPRATFEQKGEKGLDARRQVIHGGIDPQNLQTAGKMMSEGAPESVSDKEQELKAKAQEDGLDTDDKNLASSLGIETGETKGENSLEGLKQQVAELQEKMKKDGETGVIDFNDVVKLSELKDKILTEEMKKLTSGNSDILAPAKIENLDGIRESVEALQAQAKNIAEIADLEPEQAELKKAA